MTHVRDTLNACTELVSFVTKYSQVIGYQLEDVHKVMAATVQTVMDGIQKLSETTETKKREAENVLEQTYLRPDSETIELVTSIQNSVDDIFEQASTGGVVSPGGAVKRVPDNDSLRRFGGQFSKHMESLSTLDDSIKELLLSMMGALSSDDVIRQRLDHIAMGIAALQVGLNYLLVDIDNRFTPAQVERFRRELLEYTSGSYTMEEERDLFAEIFADFKPKKLKAG